MPRPVQVEPISAGRVVLVPALALGGSVFLGMMAVRLRPFCDVGGLHWEAVGSLGMLVLASIGLMGSHRRHGVLPALCVLQLELAALWVGFPIGFSVAYGRIWDDVILVFGGWGAGSDAVLCLVLALTHWLWPARQRFGPWCPQCGYWLIGLVEHRCPECGRAFTLAELKITEEDLRAPLQTGDDRERGP